MLQMSLLHSARCMVLDKDAGNRLMITGVSKLFIFGGIFYGNEKTHTIHLVCHSDIVDICQKA